MVSIWMGLLLVQLSRFRLLLWNYRTEFKETWQEARSQRPLPSLCFSGPSEKQDGRPGLWLAETFQLLNGIQRNLTGSEISTSSTKFMFSGWSEKQDGLPGFWLAETFSTFPLIMLIWISWNLTGSKVSTSSTNILFLDQTIKEDSRHSLWLADTLPSFCFFMPIGKPRWLLWPICHQRWHIVLRCMNCGPLGLFFVFA